MHLFYSENIGDIISPAMKDFCIHLFCKTGGGSLIYDGRRFCFNAGDLLVLPQPVYVSDLKILPGTASELFGASFRFLQGLLPANNFSIGGGISLHGNPVIPLTMEQGTRFLEDIRRIRDRFGEENNRFFREQIGSLCLTMMYDIFEFHAERDGDKTSSDRSGSIVMALLKLLDEGHCVIHRNVKWYADQLNVTPKYLFDTVKRHTGRSVMHYIDLHALPILKSMLDDPSLSLTQIADRMNFSSLSYFSRYCIKHLGKTPTAFRSSRQPQKSPH